MWHLVTQGDDVHVEEGGDSKKNEFEGTLRPLAVEWGGQVFQGGGQQSTYALATSLTTVCHALDVEVVLEHNVGVAPYWGQMGHYTIASFACSLVQNPKLRNFIKANLSQISFTMAELSPDQIKDRLKDARDNGSIVPLADVPDIVWKQHYTKMTGGRDDKWAGAGRSTGPEHPTHYADIDEPRASDGKTLRQLCRSNSANVSIAFWQQFYNDMGHTSSRDRGLLPFRVWQFFTAMQKAAAARKPADFLCAAGILSHYVGDACQPLHGSVYADGYKDRPTEITHHRPDSGEEYTTQSHEGAGVHSAYESKMVDRYAEDLIQAIQTKVSGLAHLAAPSSGQAAAIATVALMDRSAKTIPPTDLVDSYVEAGGTSRVAVLDALWEQYGDATAKVMADGARVLAAIWDGAWVAGSGSSIATGSLGKIPADKLQALYEDENFVKSLDLDSVRPEL